MENVTLFWRTRRGVERKFAVDDRATFATTKKVKLENRVWVMSKAVEPENTH
mgnify:CR=1 FL=1